MYHHRRARRTQGTRRLGVRAALGVAGLVAAYMAAMSPSAALASANPPGHGPAPAPANAPVAHTHAHNDYLHDHPLFDALSHGFDSVESDIWLADNGALVADPLLVGHTKAALQHGQTIQDLYLDPLLALTSTNASGHVYAGSTAQVTLLVDVKSDASSTYAVLDTLLRTPKYAPMLTSWTKTGANSWTTQVGPVRVLISGNRDRATMTSQPQRYAAYDGRLSDLFTTLPAPGIPPVLVSQLPAASFMPLISQSWSSVFAWHGTGAMPADQQATLATIMSAAHANGQEIRFYGTPDRSGTQYLAVWAAEAAAGVDWLNTDMLAELQAFLFSNPY